MAELKTPEYNGNLRRFRLRAPEPIYACSGIKIFDRRIKSLVFTTDPCIIRNCNADAVIAVYPFTPQPAIMRSVMLSADVPVFAGVGGGLTGGSRVIDLAHDAEFEGAIGVVVNGPTKNEIIKELKTRIDIPIVVTVVNEDISIAERIEAGASILNVSCAAKTAQVVRNIRKDFPDIAIIATGGPNDESIKETIEAGANAITWTPPSNGEIFKNIMQAYRENQPHP